MSRQFATSCPAEWIAEGRMETQPTPCPICACPYTDTIAAKIVGGQTFRVLQCCNVDCLHGFLTPLPTLELLDSIYSQERLNDYLVDEGAIQQHMQFFSHLFEVYIPQAFPAPGRLLDIGAGVGTFAAVAQKFGWEAAGVEGNQQSVNWAAEKFDVQLHQGNFYCLEDFFTPQSFDLITFNHVFEHVLEPHAFVPYVAKFVRPHGGVLLTVPNILSDDFRRQRALWSYIHIPAHISYFSRLSMDMLFVGKVRLPTGRFEKVFQCSFPASGQEEGEGLTSLYRLLF